MPCSSETARRFGRTYRLDLQGRRWNQTNNQKAAEICRWFLDRHTLRPWRWRRHFRPIYQALSELHDVIAQKTVIFNVAGLRISNAKVQIVQCLLTKWTAAIGVEVLLNDKHRNGHWRQRPYRCYHCTHKVEKGRARKRNLIISKTSWGSAFLRKNYRWKHSNKTDFPEIIFRNTQRIKLQIFTYSDDQWSHSIAS
jgi:hypothetical protein